MPNPILNQILGHLFAAEVGHSETAEGVEALGDSRVFKTLVEGLDARHAASLRWEQQFIVFTTVENVLKVFVQSGV